MYHQQTALGTDNASKPEKMSVQYVLKYLFVAELFYGRSFYHRGGNTCMYDTYCNTGTCGADEYFIQNCFAFYDVDASDLV